MTTPAWGAMNPNSGNQRWSQWTITATQTKRVIPYPLFKDHVTRFARSTFGSVGQMQVLEKTLEWVVEVRCEGVPAHDPGYVDHVRRLWTGFLIKGLGLSTRVTVEARLLAGSRQDGTPPDHLIVIPTIPLVEEPPS